MKSWATFWNQREHSSPLVAIRILLGATLLYDLFLVYHYELVEPLWAPRELGGFGYADGGWPEVYRWFGPTLTTTWTLYAVTVISVFGFTIGFFTRLSGILAVVAYAQTAAILGESDRGIDMLIRSVMVILSFSGCGKSWSLDSWIRYRRFIRPEVLIPAWPRYLIILQLVWLYFLAGILKQQSAWSFGGNFVALHHILRDPAYAAADFTWIPLWMNQLGTFMTIAFERLAPFLLVYYWARNSARPGPLRCLLLRIRFRLLYLTVGAGFHVLLFFTLRIGIFPLAVLAMYPAFFRPSEFRTFFRTLGHSISHAMRHRGFDRARLGAG